MKPTEKSEGIERLIKWKFGIDRRGAIRDDRCALCGGPADAFRDDLSRREFAISGMCQKCQDGTFEE